MNDQDIVEVTYRNGQKEQGQLGSFRWFKIEDVEIFSRFSREECAEFDIVRTKLIQKAD